MPTAECIHICIFQTSDQHLTLTGWTPWPRSRRELAQSWGGGGELSNLTCSHRLENGTGTSVLPPHPTSALSVSDQKALAMATSRVPFFCLHVCACVWALCRT